MRALHTKRSRKCLHEKIKTRSFLISFLLIFGILLGSVPVFFTLSWQKADAEILDFTTPIVGTRIDGGTLANREGVADALTWEVRELYTDYWVLTVSGEGGIPDYGSTNSYNPPTAELAKRPWHNYWKNAKIKKIVFGDGINYIGVHSFNAFYEETVDFGNNQAITLGAYCFWSNSYLSYGVPLVIPGNVKKIGQGCFTTYVKPSEIILEEGVEEICSGALGGSADTIYLPASFRTFTRTDRSKLWRGAAIVVAEDNPYFQSIDGVLYSKDGSVLVEYPTNKICNEFRVPDHVRTIAGYAFLAVEQTQKLYIPSTVELVEGVYPGYIFGWSYYEEVYIEDGVVLGDAGSHFYQTDTIRKIRFPDGSRITNGMYDTGNQGPKVESFNIPAQGTLPSGSLTKSLLVEEIDYEAIDGFKNSSGSGNALPAECRFTLNVAKTVDVLRWQFYEFSQKAETISFEGPNHINIIPTAGKTEPFAYALGSLKNLTGTIYVDAQGVVYAYDESAATAQLVYVPAGLNAVTVPATVLSENSKVCTVTSVKENCLSQATGLRSITFANPANITAIGVYGLGNCPTLTSVNGQTTVAGATAVFANATLGYQPFYNTGLTGAPGAGAYEDQMDGKKHLVLSRDGFTDLNLSFQSTDATWQGTETVGGYRLLTGASLGINATVGSTGGSENLVYRVYYRMSDGGDLSARVGQTYTFDNGLIAKCYATQAPDTVYMEFTPPVGDTNTVFVSAVFPNFTSPGGEITVWGCLLTKEEATATQEQILEPANGQTLQAYWTTIEDSFGVSKSSAGAAPQLVGDGQGNAMPDSDIVWTIDFARSDDQSHTLGKDLIRSVEYTDVVTFPAGVNWSPRVIQAAKDGTVGLINGGIYADGEKVMTLTCTGGNLGGGTLVWDEQRQTVVFSWSVRNPSRTVELGSSNLKLTFHPQALQVDMSVYDRETENVLKNTVTATVHYTFAQDAVVQASATRSIGTGEGVLQLTKVADRLTTPKPFMGEDVTFTLQVSNVGALPYVATDGVYQLLDEMEIGLYIKPENLQRMFEEDPNLVVTVNTALLQPWVEKTGADGGDAWQYAGNHSTSTRTANFTLTRVDNGYQVVQGKNVYTAATVYQVLKDVGYSVTRNDRYYCYWSMNAAGENWVVNNGQPIIRHIYATFKDSFNGKYMDYNVTSKSNNWVGNTAKLKNPAGTVVIQGSTPGYSAVYEAHLHNNVYLNGKQLEDLSEVKHGDVLDYKTSLIHNGNGEYENLPIIQDIYGCQYLLVPKNQNPQLKGQNLPEHGKYYVLTDGTYTNVVVGQTAKGQYLIAASITVGTNTGEIIKIEKDTVLMTGVYTRVEWFFPELPGKDYQLDIHYQALVDMSVNDDITFTLGNWAFANDTLIADAGYVKGVGRLYDAIFGQGSSVENDKHVVTVKGKTPDHDLLADELPVGVGDQVQYRLDLHAYSDFGTVTVRGNKLADILPDTHGVFLWEKGVNITDLRIEGTEGVTWQGVDDWYIGDDYLGEGTRPGGYILWPETTTITIPHVKVFCGSLSLI